MDYISQAVRIALGLVVVLVAGILLAPTQPTLFAVRPDAPVAAVEPETDAPAPPTATAPQPVAPAGPTPADQPQPVRPAPVPVPAEPAAETDAPPAADAEEPGPPAPEAPVADEAEPEAPSLADLTAEPPPLDFRLYREPQVTAATSLRAGGRDIRLAGLASLPADARCASGAACGETARRAVTSFLAGRSILCSVAIGRADAGAVTAPCLAGEDDIGAWIVRNGWADAGPGSRYEEAAETARTERRGIWAEGGPTTGAAVGD